MTREFYVGIAVIVFIALLIWITPQKSLEDIDMRDVCFGRYC